MSRGKTAQGATAALAIAAVLILLFGISSNTFALQSIISLLNAAFSAVGCVGRVAIGGNC